MKDLQKSVYQFPLSVIKKAGRFGLTLQELKEMVVLSARVTHPAGNRRYHDYVFMVEGDSVVDIVPFGEEEAFYRCETCKDNKKVVVFDECPLCEGEGCRRCDKGLIRNFISCPVCGKI